MIVGIDYNDFWRMTPHDVKLIMEGYQRRQEQDIEMKNTMMFIQGRYVVDALACTVGNMFSRKGSQANKYPSKPYDITPPRELTEEEKNVQVKAIFDNLLSMKRSFDMAHGKSGGDI